MNKKQYDLAKKDVSNLKKKLKKLEKDILEYENKNERPSFKNERDFRHFIMYAEDGTLVDYDEKTYEVNGVAEFEREYGHESMLECVLGGKNFDDLLVGNRIGMLTLKNNK